MHKELNIRLNKDLDENQGYLIKRKEDKTNKADMTFYFLRYFKENFNSIISKTFFGIMKNKNKRLVTAFAFICLFASFALITASLYKGINLQILLKEASNEPGYINEGDGLIGLLFYYSISVTELIVFILSITLIIKAKRDKRSGGMEHSAGVPSGPVTDKGRAMEKHGSQCGISPVRVCEKA